MLKDDNWSNLLQIMQKFDEQFSLFFATLTQEVEDIIKPNNKIK
jgi:hypothetical protein